MSISSRLLDLLLEVNGSPQIPPERRIDLSLKPSSNNESHTLPIDRDHALQKVMAMKKLEQMLHDVPHFSYSTAKEKKPSFVTDLAPCEGETHPANFLSADDVDDYTHVVDLAVRSEHLLPTLAPCAHHNTRLLSSPHLKNPTSVTNWLRKHAPKIFLQDGEPHADGDDGEGATAAVTGGTSSHTGGRKSRGGARGERGGAKTNTKSKKTAASARISSIADRGDWDASMDEDPDFGATPVGRGKRKRDDDGGYRPRGSSSRPTKKKRKSEVDGTPTVRKSKKDTSVAVKEE